MYSFVVYLYVNGSGSITSVGEERANFSAVVYLQLCGFCLERFPLPLGAWDGLRYFIVALPEPFYIIILNDVAVTSWRVSIFIRFRISGDWRRSFT